MAEALVRLWPWIEAALGKPTARLGRGQSVTSCLQLHAAKHSVSPAVKAATCNSLHSPTPHSPPHPTQDRFTGDAAAIERICRAPRYAVRSSGKAAAAAVPLLVASLPQRFEVSRQPCFLYVASELIKTFGDEPARDLELGECGDGLGERWNGVGWRGVGGAHVCL